MRGLIGRVLGHRCNRRKSAEDGVTMVEFALSSTVFLGVVGFFFEIGLGFFYYMLLVQSTAASARRTALDVKAGTNASVLPAVAAAAARDDLLSAFGVDGSRITFNAELVPGPQNKCYLRVHGAWRLNCFFCMLFPDGLEIDTQSDSLIEDECFVGGCP